MKLTYFGLLKTLFISTCLSQSFYIFGSYEYYWSTEEENYVESYSEAEDQCRQMNATLTIVNVREVGEWLNREIGPVPREQLSYFKLNQGI